MTIGTENTKTKNVTTFTTILIINFLLTNLKIALCENCLNTEVFWSESRKIRTRKNSVFGHFSRRVAFKTLQIKNFKKPLMTKKYSDYTTTKKLRNMLVRAKFKTNSIPKSPKLTGLFLKNEYVYHKARCILACSSF